MVKRKRVVVSAAPYFARAPAGTMRKKRKVFVPGADRVGGYYGRYAGAGGAVSGERKFHDVDLDDNVISSGGTVTDSINKIAQGVTESQRIGRKCTIKSINWSWNINLPEVDAAATPSAADIARLIVFVDKQCNGATAAVLDILETADFNSFRNLSNSGRFQVLMDRRIDMNYMGLASDNAGVVSQAQIQHYGSFYKNCNIPIEFDNTTGAITEIRSNNIGILVISISGNPVFKSKIRLRFSDGAR